MEKSLTQLEADVEAARAKLAVDMAIVQSDATRTQFFESAQQDVLALKDRVLSSAADSAKSKVTDVVEALKAKAAQNPAAVLAIAAGVGWRIYKNPPIASALVGLGLYSLLKADAVPTAHPLETAKRRAKEQVASAAEAAQSAAASVTSSIMDNVDNITQPARDAADEMLSQARRHLHDAQDVVSEKFKYAQDRLPFSNDNTSRETATRGDSTQLRDTALLAVAGIAVAASLGLAWQKRSEPVE